MQSTDAFGAIAKGAALFAVGRTPFEQIVPEHIVIEVKSGDGITAVTLVEAGATLPIGSATEPIENRHQLSAPEGRVVEIPVLTEDPVHGAHSRRYHGKLFKRFEKRLPVGAEVNHKFWVDRNGLLHQEFSIKGAENQNVVSDTTAIWSEDPEYSLPPESWDEVEDLFQRERYSLVVKSLELKPDSFGDNALYWNTLGVSYSRLGRHTEALDCDRIFFEKKSSGISYGNVVYALIRVNHLGELADFLRTHSADFCDDLYAVSATVKGYSELGDSESTRRCAEKYLDENPEFGQLAGGSAASYRGLLKLVGRATPLELELAEDVVPIDIRGERFLRVKPSDLD